MKNNYPSTVRLLSFSKAVGLINNNNNHTVNRIYDGKTSLFFENLFLFILILCTTLLGDQNKNKNHIFLIIKNKLRYYYKS